MISLREKLLKTSEEISLYIQNLSLELERNPKATTFEESFDKVLLTLIEEKEELVEILKKQEFLATLKEVTQKDIKRALSAQGITIHKRKRVKENSQIFDPYKFINPNFKISYLITNKSLRECYCFLTLEDKNYFKSLNKEFNKFSQSKIGVLKNF